MARRKKLIILSGMQTKYLSTLASWLESAEIKKPETDNYGENPELRAILDSILRDNGSWVFDCTTHYNDFKIADEQLELVKAWLKDEYAKKANTGAYKDVLFIKDGRTTPILVQLAKGLKNIDILVYTVVASGKANEFLQGFEFEDPKLLMKVYGKHLGKASEAGLASFTIKMHSFKEFPEDFSSLPDDFFKYLKKKRLIKEIPEFEDLDITPPPTPPEPEGWDDGDEEELKQAIEEGI